MSRVELSYTGVGIGVAMQVSASITTSGLFLLLLGDANADTGISV
jgi:hypothetical protein